MNEWLPSVAVIIPNHDRVTELQEAVDSVGLQDYRGQITIYVVYRYRPGIENVLSDLPVKVVPVMSSDESGRNSIAVKRNLGLDAGTEDLVAFLDDDDIWHPGKLSAQVAVFQRSTTAVAVGSRPCYFSDRPMWRSLTPDGSFRERSRRQVISGRYFGTSSLLVDGAAARELRFDERPDWLALEDYDFKIRLSQLGLMREVRGRYTAYRNNIASISVEERRHTLLRALSVLAASAERDPLRLPQQLVALRLLVVSTFGGFGTVQDFHGTVDNQAETFLSQILDGRLFGRLDKILYQIVRTGWRRGWKALLLRGVLRVLRTTAIRLRRIVRSMS